MVKLNYDVKYFVNKMSLFQFIEINVLQSYEIIDLEIVKISFFLNTCDNNEFYSIIKEVSDKIKDKFEENNKVIPALSFIAQSPLDNSFACLEILLIEKGSLSKPLIPLRLDGVEGIKAVTKFGSYLFTSFSHSNFNKISTNVVSVYNSINTAFRDLEQLLKLEDLNFSNVIRQWTYIEKVLDLENFENGLKQFYQVFNDVRSIYFGKCKFQNGYMAATGIGSNAGIISTELIAFKNISNSKSIILPISNPRQINSFQYSESKLVGTPLSELKVKTTPKFERAKLLIFENLIQLFISGTASVFGEDTAQVNDVSAQTKFTLENIDILIKEANRHIPSKHHHFLKTNIISARIYIKYPADYEKVKMICVKYFKTNKLVFVQANVCRDNLLVEIETYLEKVIN